MTGGGQAGCNMGTDEAGATEHTNLKLTHSIKFVLISRNYSNIAMLVAILNLPLVLLSSPEKLTVNLARMFRLHCIASGFLLLMFFSTMALAEGVIETIRFEGNEVTQESVMREEMVVTEGDPVDIERIEWSVQYIMNLGIFERVTYRIEEAEQPGNIVLVVIVTSFPCRRPSWMVITSSNMASSYAGTMSTA